MRIAITVDQWRNQDYYWGGGGGGGGAGEMGEQ